jgi:uncharacterized membrane protein
MAKEKFEDDVDCCLSCGAVRFVPSKEASICIECNPADPRYPGSES